MMAKSNNGLYLVFGLPLNGQSFCIHKRRIRFGFMVCFLNFRNSHLEHYTLPKATGFPSTLANDFSSHSDEITFLRFPFFQRNCEHPTQQLPGSSASKQTQIYPNIYIYVSYMYTGYLYTG